ncbi:MAG: fatty acid hydroxylase [Gemmatimonadales bacterium]|nr:fatty acid hydroxylase [Gemmatimonadales bacterium]NIN10851.1 fatty acid hydroxylase [Gemmatimonadales bacterium]NIR02859.1 fatty acid hydroxylase [Gemmatimonadales bacterium]NIS66493.1 fatty acid hydroxylase [Gemmatimonadales bacterium]
MAKKYVSNKDVSVRIFKSNVLEALSHVHPVVPHVLYLPVIAYVLYSASAVASVARIGAMIALGLLLWTVAEYFIHRFMFHATPEVEERVRQIVGRLAPGEAALSKLTGLRQKHYFLAHGAHHDFPNDTKRLVMPPSISIPLAILFYSAFRLLLGPGDGPALFAGFTLGYLIYDTIHYAVHHFSLRDPVLLYLKKQHYRHHYQDAERDFGVSSPLWDLVLGTMGRAKSPREAVGPPA